ncbi:superoxide dismutase [Mortierella sp. GBAus27b]|nr:superoxide dismutase [Mortierella sp. GBAus27b]
MQFKTIAALLAVAGIATAQTTDYKSGKAHIDQAGIDAVVTFEKVAGGVNVTVVVNKGLTKELQILPEGFDYHVHVKPVIGGNCTTTGGHLDPFNIGPKPCDPKNMTSCQVGDLSGKWGNLTADPNSAVGAIAARSYVDSSLSFSGDSSLLGRSVVIHNNMTRIACADIVVDGYTPPATNSSTGAPGTPGSTGGNSSAVKLVGSVALTGLVAMMMMAL